MGVSIFRGTDRRFCSCRLNLGWCVACLEPWVKDVTEWLKGTLRGEGEESAVVVHLGTNDIVRKSDVVLRKDFSEVGNKLAKRTSEVVNSGLLP